MTIFEYLTVAVSIVLGLGLSKLVSSVPFVFASNKRDWLHILSFIFLIIAHIIVWWNIWLLNGISDWNIFQFAIIMGSPLSLYLAATAIVSADPSQVSDWKQHFASHSHWMFSALAAALALAMLRAEFIATYGTSWATVIAFFGMLFCAFSNKRSVHANTIILGYIFLAYILTRNFVAIQN